MSDLGVRVTGVLKIEVRSRIPGPAGDAPPSVLVGLASEQTTVRELIRRTVEEQIRELRADAARCRRALDRQYLSTEEIRAQAATGVVRYQPHDLTAPDPAREVDRAHRAFTNGVIAIFVGGRQVTELDEPIEVRLGEPVTFLRLVALVGG
jgi:hypothetical protein